MRRVVSWLLMGKLNVVGFDSDNGNLDVVERHRTFVEGLKHPLSNGERAVLGGLLRRGLRLVIVNALALRLDSFQAPGESTPTDLVHAEV